LSSSPKKMRTGEEDTLKLQARMENCQRHIERYQAVPSNKKKAKKWPWKGKIIHESIRIQMLEITFHLVLQMK
jgi:hypothetical protein